MTTTHPRPSSPPGPIVVGVDGSASSQLALRWALDQSQRTGQAVRAVTVRELSVDGDDDRDWATSAQQVLRTALETAADGADLAHVESIVVHGHPAGALLEAAANADLVVMGDRGSGGLSGMSLGPVSQQVVAHACCPVLVVHPQETAEVL